MLDADTMVEVLISRSCRRSGQENPTPLKARSRWGFAAVCGGDSSSHRYRVELPALIGPLQGRGVKGGVEPGGEGPGQSARSEESGVTAGEELAERDEPDEPAMHLCGVGLQREVDGKTLVVLADGDLRTLDVEPPLGASGSGEHDMHHGAGFGQLGGDTQLVDTPDQRQPVAVLLAR